MESPDEFMARMWGKEKMERPDEMDMIRQLAEAMGIPVPEEPKPLSDEDFLRSCGIKTD